MSGFPHAFAKAAEAAAQPAAKGAGSRGGKVVGRTKSGRPIYESDRKRREEARRKSSRNQKLLGAGLVLGAAALRAAPAIRKHLQWRKFKQTAEAYDKAGGPGRASKATWEAFKQAGDRYTRGSGAGSRWERTKRQFQDMHDAYKRAANEARSRGGARTAREAGRVSSSVAQAARTKIPGLGRVKTKKEAERAYKARMMQVHPDRGGSTEAAQEVNAAWGDIRRSEWYEKLAMARCWSMLAEALVR